MADDPRLQQAMALGEAGQYDQAKQLLQQVLAEYPRDPDVAFGLGALAYRQHDFGAAVKYWSWLAANHPGQCDIEFWLARAQSQAKPPQPAAEPAPQTASAASPPPQSSNTSPPPLPKMENAPPKQFRLGVDDYEVEPPKKAGLGTIITAVVLVAGCLGLAGFLAANLFKSRPTIEDVQLAKDPETALRHILGLLGQYSMRANPDATLGRVLSCFTAADKKWYEENYQSAATPLTRQGITDAVARAITERELFMYCMLQDMPTGHFIHTVEPKAIEDRHAEFRLLGKRLTPEKDEIHYEFEVALVKEGKLWKGVDFFGGKPGTAKVKIRAVSSQAPPAAASNANAHSHDEETEFTAGAYVEP